LFAEQKDGSPLWRRLAAQRPSFNDGKGLPTESKTIFLNWSGLLSKANAIRQSYAFGSYSHDKISCSVCCCESFPDAPGCSGLQRFSAIAEEMREHPNMRSRSFKAQSGMGGKGNNGFHAILEVPKGDKHPHPRFAQLPEIESFAKTEKEKKLLAMWRGFRTAASPFVLPPGTPKDRVEILQEAMRKAFNDPEFRAEFKKLVTDDVSH
jgi:hypothetical protein